MELKKYIEVTVKTSRRIEIEEIKGTDFVFFKETKWIDKEGKREKKISVGVTTKENVEKVNELSQISLNVPAPKMYETTAQVVMIRDDLLERARKGNVRIEKVVEKVQYPLPDHYQLYLWNVGAWQLANLNYEFISMPITFDELLINNENFDLDQVLKHLKENPYVLKKEQLQINEIPYYNAYEDRTHAISFSCLLPDDIYNKYENESKCSFDRQRLILRNRDIDIIDFAKEGREKLWN